MKRRCIRPRVKVTGGGRGLTNHSGARLLADLADATGLTEGLSVAMAPTKQRRRGPDRGQVLVDLAVMIADGGEAISDRATLRDQLTHPRPRKRSSRRRSRLVGRPAPVSLVNAAASRSRVGGGGLWSTMHSAETAAPTRLSMIRTTSSTRCRPWAWASTRSPTRTVVAGLAGTPVIPTLPPPHAAVASLRVLYSRTAHSHRSTLVISIEVSRARRSARRGCRRRSPGSGGAVAPRRPVSRRRPW